MIAWLLIPQNAALLSLIGFFVGAVGLILTVAGLVVAIRQLSAIKTETEATTAATEATATALASLEFKVDSLDVVKQCQSALSRISEIRSALKVFNWNIVLTNYEELISGFLKLAHSSAVIAEADTHAMIKMTEDMARICEGVRRNANDPSVARNLRGQDKALRNFSDIMTRLSFLVEKDLRT